MAVKKSKKQERNIIVTIGILLLFLLVLGGVRVILNKNVQIDSRIKNIEAYQKEHPQYKVSAWLKIPGTNIDYPVLDDADSVAIEDSENMDYLWKNGELEKLNRINYIMGHNIMNLSKSPKITDKNHVRFEQLMSFTYLDFAKKNEYIQLTVDGEDYLFKIFSVSYPDTYDIDNYNDSDANDNDVKIFIKRSLERSIFKYDVDINEKDTIISLITCTRMFDYERDFVVDARLVRDGESTNLYKVNKSEKYEEVENKMKGVETING